MCTEAPKQDFWKWTDELGRWYFNPEMAQRQVRLHWPIGPHFDNRGDEFLQCLRRWTSPKQPVDVALALANGWSPRDGHVRGGWAIPSLPTDGRCERPPYIPFLVAFAMAWESEGEYAPNDYYSRLNELLGLTDGRIGSAEFQWIDKLWHELEYWANTTMDGELGRFTAVSLGGMEHIGYPMSQVVLKPVERTQLERIFLREGLTPDMALSDEEILRLISRYKEHFGSRIKHSLENAGSRFLRALSEEVRIELANSPPASERYRTMRSRGSRGGHVRRITLRLACRIGLHAIHAWSFTTPADDDDLPSASSSGYAFRADQVEGALWQRTDAGTGTPDVAEFKGFAPLGVGLALEGDDGTRIAWPAYDVRFLSPQVESADLYMEEAFVPDHGPVVVLCEGKLVDSIGAIADGVIAGVPWEGVVAYRVNSPDILLPLCPNRRNYARRGSPVRFVGGLKCHPHESIYFPFALPRVAVADGWTLHTQHSSASVAPIGGGGIYSLRIAASEPPEHVTLETRDDGGRRRALTIGISNGSPMEVRAERGSNAIADALDSHEKCLPRWDDAIGSKEEPLVTNVGGQLLTVLSVWQECSYRKFCSAVNELAGSDSRHAPRITQFLYCLGHVRIQSDTATGQWRRVQIAPGAVRRLPWDIDLSGDPVAQAVIVGQYNWTKLDQQLRTLAADVDFDITPQPFCCLPPRVRLVAFDPSALRNAAAQLGLRYQDTADLPSQEDLCPNLANECEWHDGVVAPADNVTYFSPFLLSDVPVTEERLQDLCRISGGILLAGQEQSYGGYQYYLCDAMEHRRTQLPQDTRQMARWRCYTAATSEFLNKSRGNGNADLPSNACLPYTESSGQLALPYSLFPPDTISRLLIGCTGLLPTTANAGRLVDVVCSLGSGNVRSFSSPFIVPRGARLAIFNHVPRPVAEAASQALNVTLHEPVFGD